MVVISLSGFDAPLKGFGRYDWLGMYGNARIEIDNYTGRNQIVTLDFMTVSFQEPRALYVLDDKKIIWKKRILTSSTAVTVDELTLEPGKNLFVLQTPEESPTKYEAFSGEEPYLLRIRGLSIAQ